MLLVHSLRTWTSQNHEANVRHISYPHAVNPPEYVPGRQVFHRHDNVRVTEEPGIDVMVLDDFRERRSALTLP